MIKRWSFPLTFAAVFVVVQTSSAEGCYFSFESKTLTDDARLADVVFICYVDQNQVAADGKKAASALSITHVLKDDLHWLNTKSITINRYIDIPSGKPPQAYLIFADVDSGNLDVYRDRETGQELYVGRTARPDADRSRHDGLYRQAVGLIEGLIAVHGKEPAKLDDAARRRMTEAVGLFEEVVRINPGNWPAMWLLGKIYERLHDPQRSLEWFARSHRVNPDHHDVAREAAIAAMEAGRPAEAVAY